MARRFTLPPSLPGTLRDQYPRLAERLIDAAQEQAGFLARFADEVAVSALLGRPLSPEAVAARSALYGGAGRAEFYRGKEIGQTGGWVIEYHARDDRHTCTPCLEAEEASPFLPGEGVFPGAVCRGRGRCRCRRVPRFDPITYDRLKAAA